MDNELFLRRLSEVSEWHRPLLSSTGQPSQRKGHIPKQVEHPGDKTVEELESMSEQELEEYHQLLMTWREQQPNESVPPRITKVKIQAVDCEDCGRHCPKGRRIESKLYHTGTEHWRTWCQVCQRFKDPVTGKFTVTAQVAHKYFQIVYRPRLGLRKSKYDIVRNPEPTVHEIHTDTHILRFFEHKKS